MAEAEAAMINLRTSSFAGLNRVDAFRQAYWAATRVDIEPMLDVPFDLDVTIRAFPEFRVATGTTTPMRSRNSATDDDGVMLICMQQGDGSMLQDGRQVHFSDGEAIFVSNGLPGVLLAHTRSSLATLRLSRATLASMSIDIETVLSRPLTHTNPALQLVMRYAEIANDDCAMATPELRSAVILHLYDLVALAIGATDDVAGNANSRGVVAARLKAAKDFIHGNVLDPDLNDQSIALHLGVGPRYIRKLFEQAGIGGCAAYIKQQRLNMARRMLASPAHTHRRIIDIALLCGFNDIGTFNRLFRANFGASPSEIRAQDRKPG